MQGAERLVRALLARALLAFLALPVTVAMLVPWLLVRGDPSTRWTDWLGLLPLGSGAVLLVWCVGTFYAAGRGTLAPWDPPRKLVVTGAYRFSRNPMYLAVLLVLAGWAVAYRSRTLALYALSFAVAFHLRVVLAEEPWLERTYGESWRRYRARVPRWLGRVRD